MNISTALRTPPSALLDFGSWTVRRLPFGQMLASKSTWNFTQTQMNQSQKTVKQYLSTTQPYALKGLHMSMTRTLTCHSYVSRVFYYLGLDLRLGARSLRGVGICEVLKFGCPLQRYSSHPGVLVLRKTDDKVRSSTTQRNSNPEKLWDSVTLVHQFRH